jgi:ketosteroid isomerase-like protein
MNLSLRLFLFFHIVPLGFFTPPRVLAQLPIPPIQGDCQFGLLDNPSERFVRDLRSKNIDDILIMYAPDAVFVQPSGETISGTEAMQTLYKQIFNEFDSDLTLSPGNISSPDSSDSPVCVEWGTYTENLRIRSTGETKYIHGTYRFAYLHRCNEWLLRRQEWDTPPANNSLPH